MHHQRNVNVLKAALFFHDDLSADRLLCRRSVNDDLIRLFTAYITKCQSGSDHRRSLHVVSAGMSDIFYSIIFCQKAKGRTTAALLVYSPEGCRKSCNSTFYLKSFCFQIFG